VQSTTPCTRCPHQTARTSASQPPAQPQAPNAPQEEFDEHIADDDFLEYAKVEDHGYGITRAAVDRVQARGQVAVLDVNVAGAASCKKQGLVGVYVFIAAPSMEDVRSRLKGHGAIESEEELDRHVATAEAEMAAKDEAGVFEHTIVNADLDAAYAELVALLRAEIERLTALAGDDEYETPAQAALKQAGEAAAAPAAAPAEAPAAADGAMPARADPRRRAEEYLERHNVLALLEHLSSAVLFERPADPRAMLAEELQRVQACQREGVAVAPAFSEADLTAMFGMFDVTRCGAITHAQLAQAMANLGLPPDAVPPDAGARVPLADFLFHAQAALDRAALRMPRPGERNDPGFGGQVPLPPRDRRGSVGGARRASVASVASEESEPMTPPGKPGRSEPYYWPGRKQAPGERAPTLGGYVPGKSRRGSLASLASEESEPMTPPGKPARSEPYYWPGRKPDPEGEKAP